MKSTWSKYPYVLPFLLVGLPTCPLIFGAVMLRVPDSDVSVIAGFLGWRNSGLGEGINDLPRYYRLGAATMLRNSSRAEPRHLGYSSRRRQ